MVSCVLIIKRTTEVAKSLLILITLTTPIVRSSTFVLMEMSQECIHAMKAKFSMMNWNVAISQRMYQDVKIGMNKAQQESERVFTTSDVSFLCPSLSLLSLTKCSFDVYFIHNVRRNLYVIRSYNAK